MDFITELPRTSKGFDNLLVIVDKLTKYAIFVPTTIGVNEVETAGLFFKHVVTHFGLPRQIITDRDSRWSGNFWGELCRVMGMQRSLTTAYHPQADGQTEIMNQYLEIALRAYIGVELKDWDEYLDAISLSFNTTPHSITKFAPAFLLYGFKPTTYSTLPGSDKTPVRRFQSSKSEKQKDPNSIQITHEDTVEMFTAGKPPTEFQWVSGQDTWWVTHWFSLARQGGING
jgi:transposase InsO family protein